MATTTSLPIGSHEWEIALARFKAFDALTERRFTIRLAELEASPDDPNLAAGCDVIAQEWSFSMGRTAHFEETGEILPHPLDLDPPDPPAYLCPYCKATKSEPMRVVRADVMPGNKHFGVLIPCPECRPYDFGMYCEDHGRPPMRMRDDTMRVVVTSDLEASVAEKRYRPAMKFTKDAPPMWWGEREPIPVPETPAEKRKRLIDEQKERNEHG